MQPYQKRASLVLLQSLQSFAHDGVAPALGDRLPLAVERHREVVVIEIESLVEPPARLENGGADHGAGAIPGRLEQRRERGPILAEREACEISHSMKHRIRACKDGSVGRESQRNGC